MFLYKKEALAERIEDMLRASVTRIVAAGANPVIFLRSKNIGDMMLIKING